MSFVVNPSSDSLEILPTLLRATQELSQELSELRQYIGADFEVLNLRFDRLEDRLDRLESSQIYEH